MLQVQIYLWLSIGRSLICRKQFPWLKPGMPVMLLRRRQSPFPIHNTAKRRMLLGAYFQVPRVRCWHPNGLEKETATRIALPTVPSFHHVADNEGNKNI
jgi:hypothetical protein